MSLRRARCDCGRVWKGEKHYYGTRYCVCGRWLYWDKYSSFDVEITQAQSTIWPVKSSVKF